jgi:hypothetical protein
MNLVAVKAPAARVTFPGKPPELLDALFGVIAARQLLQVIADQLIEAFAESVRLLASAGNNLIKPARWATSRRLKSADAGSRRRSSDA